MKNKGKNKIEIKQHKKRGKPKKRIKEKSNVKKRSASNKSFTINKYNFDSDFVWIKKSYRSKTRPNVAIDKSKEESNFDNIFKRNRSKSKSKKDKEKDKTKKKLKEKMDNYQEKLNSSYNYPIYSPLAKNPDIKINLADDRNNNISQIIKQRNEEIDDDDIDINFETDTIKEKKKKKMN